MKKINILTACLMAMMTMTFTSCMDEDTHESMVLSGQWYGDFGMFYEVQDRYGRWVTFDSYDTDIVFYPQYDYATYGYGDQVDYYKYGPYEFLYYRFKWEVRNGVLYMNYPYNPELNTTIYDYRMSNDYFQGRFGSSNTTFRLRKLVDYYDWGYYNNHGNYWYGLCDNFYDYYDYDYGFGYDYGHGYPYPYSTRATDTSSLDTSKIRHGNRFNK